MLPWRNWIAHRFTEPRVAGSNPAGSTRKWMKAASMGPAITGRFLPVNKRSRLANETTAKNLLALLRIMQVIPRHPVLLPVIEVVTVDPSGMQVGRCKRYLRFTYFLPVQVVGFTEITQAANHKIHLRLPQVAPQGIDELFQRAGIGGAEFFARVALSLHPAECHRFRGGMILEEFPGPGQDWLVIGV